MRVGTAAAVAFVLMLGGCIGDDSSESETEGSKDGRARPHIPPPSTPQRDELLSRPLAATCGQLGFGDAGASGVNDAAVDQVAAALAGEVEDRGRHSEQAVTRTFAATIRELCGRSGDSGYRIAARIRARTRRVVNSQRGNEYADFLEEFVVPYAVRPTPEAYTPEEDKFISQADRRCALFPTDLRRELDTIVAPGGTRSGMARRLAIALRALADDLEALGARSKTRFGEISTAGYVEDLRWTAREVIPLGRLNDLIPRQVYRDLNAGRETHHPQLDRVSTATNAFYSRVLDTVLNPPYLPTGMDHCSLFTQ